MLQSGDSKMLEALYLAYGGRLLNKMSALVHNLEVAEELVQDVFVQIWQERGALDASVPIEAILLRKAKSKAIDFYRSSVRDARQRELLIQQGSAQHEPITEMLYFKETKDAIEQAIAKLPPQRQKVFRLCKLEGRSYEYAAERFEVSVGTIKDHMAKSMRFLKDELKDYMLEFGLFLLAASHLFDSF